MINACANDFILKYFLVWYWVFFWCLKKYTTKFFWSGWDRKGSLEHNIVHISLFSLVPPQEQPAQANISNICTGLEILCFLLTVLQSPAILAHFKPLQRGIAACMTCGNTKVLRAVHSLLSRLMSIFPTEPSKFSVPNVSILSKTYQGQMYF